jgi:uncharacterized lipoprotein
MKKLFKLVLVLVMVGSLAACSSETATEEERTLAAEKIINKL